MKRPPKISETEWEVMKVLWARSPLTAGEIIEALASKDSTWHPKTAGTLLNRLVKKRAVGFRKEGRTHLYRPLVREADCVAAASESFLERVFSGSLMPMVAHFAQHNKLSAAEKAELKRLLDEENK